MRAALLTGGFLLPRDTSMDSGTRRAYTDDGRFVVNGRTFWYDSSDRSWYSVQTGGTAIIGF